jgi:hypothetical protein
MQPPISFEDARQIVARARRNVGRRGNYMIAGYGYESPQHWLIIDGARELLVDGDPAFLVVGEGPLLVDKFTGELIELPSLYDFDYLNTFTPVGDVPASNAQ